MRIPNFEVDGWVLEDAEALHQEYPETFHIPDLPVRLILQPGDYAKLIFRIAVEDNHGGATERLWVIVRERLGGIYIGIVDNEPTLIEENEFLWRGTELPFEPRHIIAVEHASAQSREIISKPSPIPWSGL